jgi:hypothetical protein
MNKVGATKKPKRPRVKTLWRVGKGVLTPYDNATLELLRTRKYNMGDVLAAELSKPRNPRFHRLAHALGELVAHHIDAFRGMGCHDVLKRLQIEGNIGCDEIALNFPGIGPCSYRIPQSLSFESMDDGRFHEVISAMCMYIAERYWPGIEPESIQQMAEVWVMP